jgi:hypothetical protein
MCVVAAELIAAQSGLGYMIQQNRVLLQTQNVVAGMITIGVVGFANERDDGACRAAAAAVDGTREVTRAGNEAQLQIRALVKRFAVRGKQQEIVALDGIDLTVRSGEFHAAARPERLRQVDAAEHHRRFLKPTSGQAIHGDQEIRGPDRRRTVCSRITRCFRG